VVHQYLSKIIGIYVFLQRDRTKTYDIMTKYPFPYDLVSVLPLSHILLNLCSKDALFDLCDDYLIPCRRSMNKTQLVLCFESTLIKAPEILARCLPLNELLALQKIVGAGGILHSNEPLDALILESQSLIVFYEKKLSVSGKHSDAPFLYTIAGNLQKLLKPVIDRWVIDPKVRESDHKERVLMSLLRLYGVLSEEKLRELWERMTGNSLELYELFDLFRNRIGIRNEFLPVYIENKLFFSSVILDFPESFYRDINKRNDLDYAIYSKDFVMAYSNAPFQTVNVNNAAQLVSCLNNKNSGDMDLTAAQIGQIWESIQSGEKGTVLVSKLSELFSFKSIDEINSLMRFVMDFSNDTPQWLLKGHTPNELFSKNPIDLKDKSFRKSINDQLLQKFPDANPDELWRKVDTNDSNLSMKVGRNDLCPCGSGKKYKKCCGAN